MTQCAVGQFGFKRDHSADSKGTTDLDGPSKGASTHPGTGRFPSLVAGFEIHSGRF